MQMFSRDDLRLRTLTTSDGLRFLIAEFIDEYDAWAMGFFVFRHGMYDLVNIPQYFSPSSQLNERLWKFLDTSDTPALAVPGGGYYYGNEYHTVRGSAMETSILRGTAVDEIEAADGNIYSFVVSQQGSVMVAYIGIFAGTLHYNTPYQVDMWRPIPTPQVLLKDKAEMYGLIGLADSVGACFVNFEDRLN